MTETYAGQNKDSDLGSFKRDTPRDRRLTAAAYAALLEQAVLRPEGAEAKFLNDARKDGWIVEEPKPRDMSVSDMRPQLIEGYDRPDRNES